MILCRYFHFVCEIWPRIGPYIDALKGDPDVVLHTSDHWPAAKGTGRGEAERGLLMQAPFFELLGIPKSRLVSGPVFADEVFIPQVRRVE